MEAIDLICLKCKHFAVNGIGCAAFPDGIPDEIQFKNKHDKPLKNQGNDIVFEPIAPIPLNMLNILP